MLDELDKAIVSELKINSKISMNDLGKKINLTGQATNNRVKKLEDAGIITGYTIDLNQEALDCKVHVFINIYTHKISHRSYLEFVNKETIFILNNYKVIGDACYLLECRFPDNNSLNKFLERLNNHANYNVSMVIS
ncbi:Lrp/AsnC family transcriptional regulator [Staphylococcus succinus]|nr:MULTISPECIES: Lrp/AsnC family transcriptional regulator [Staphylococcus]MBU0437912.1 Lrp/AsnC family transcriptional regulator [Staphylococcus succinus]MDH9162457.1 Lrp/AsnC family transcriptional regulator [Staphylococcus succinus]MEB7461264.1 Lrp/AsnC family transcriptional regulator [Staphylococcus succinus]MEB8124780.1 Lrp/AsnC family transcriptional regulator [Staphylococcus succinus]MEB8126773.1 Lrp/AsnC family transcriptional regulator [Staphylococcus succinus]